MKQRSKKRGTGTPRTHGMAHTLTYRAWVEMKRRCFAAHRKEYVNYGKRGITVCSRWMSFQQFFADMGERPEGMELDRMDVDGNYEPGNCRWATELEQQNNRRTNVRIEINGQTRTISEWARLNGICPRTAAQRIRAGWPPEIAVSRQSDKGKKLCA